MLPIREIGAKTRYRRGDDSTRQDEGKGRLQIDRCVRAEPSRQTDSGDRRFTDTGGRRQDDDGDRIERCTESNRQERGHLPSRTQSRSLVSA